MIASTILWIIVGFGAMIFLFIIAMAIPTTNFKQDPIRPTSKYQFAWRVYKGDTLDHYEAYLRHGNKAFFGGGVQPDGEYITLSKTDYEKEVINNLQFLTNEESKGATKQ